MSMKDGNSFVILTTALWLYSNPCKWISCQNVWQLLEDRACRYSCVTHVSSPAEMPCGTMKTRLRDICTVLHNTSLTELWHFIVHCTTLLTAPISLSPISQICFYYARGSWAFGSSWGRTQRPSLSSLPISHQIQTQHDWPYSSAQR